MPVLARGKGQTSAARMWVYMRDAPGLVHQPHRRRGSRTRQTARVIHPQTHLSQFHGVLQADAYAGYDKVCAGGHMREAACMAHASRKIHEQHTTKAKVTTTEALRRIAQLYAIEKQLRGQPPDRRQTIRQQQARPLLDNFETWLRTRLLTLLTQSDTTKASTKCSTSGRR